MKYRHLLLPGAAATLLLTATATAPPDCRGDLATELHPEYMV